MGKGSSRGNGSPTGVFPLCVRLLNAVARRLTSRPAGGGPQADPIAAAMQAVLPCMLAATYLAGGRAQEVG